jgi:NitT/TauT family transport system permease protein
MSQNSLKNLRIYGTYCLSFLVIFVLWYILAVYLFPSILFPSPVSVLVRLGELIANGQLITDVVVSMSRILLGFLIGSALGIPIGLLMGNFAFVRHFLEPYTEFFRFIPAIALITVTILVFGIGEESKIALIVYTTIFMVIINTTAGVVGIPINKIRAARSLGASRAQVFFYVSFPATLPYIFTGMRIAMGNAFATIVSAEMLGANRGIGTMMWTARLYMQVDDVFVGLLVLGILGFLSDHAFRSLIRRFAGRYVPAL